MPRPPCNLHLVATWRSPDNAICKSTQHDTSRVLRLPYEITMEVAKVLRLPLKLQLIFLKRRTYHTKQFSTHYETCWSVTKCHACHAKRGYVALETSIKWPLFAELAIGTAIRASDDRPRTVADGCGCERNVERTHLQPEWNGNPCYTFGRNKCFGPIFVRLFYAHIAYCSDKFYRDLTTTTL